MLSLRRPAILSWRHSLVGMLALVGMLMGIGVMGCASLGDSTKSLTQEPPLTTSRALGQGDPARDASLRLVIAGLDEDDAGVPSRAMASYQRAIQVDSTNPFAYLALARHNLEYGSYAQADAFLDQARSLFEAEGLLGPQVDVWGVGLRAGIDRGTGDEASAGARFEVARELSFEIWADEMLSASELR